MLKVGTGTFVEHHQGQKAPTATTFINSTEEVAHYFFKNNPWKLSTANDYQKIFRFCIICGEEKFSSEKWAKVIGTYGPPAICDKPACFQSLAFVPGYVPREFLFIESLLDRSRRESAKTQEYFVNPQQVIKLLRNDKVYANESDMPAEWIEVFKRLEKYPVETRISEIDSHYFAYINRLPNKAARDLAEITDPFLIQLAAYRNRCFEILEAIRK